MKKKIIIFFGPPGSGKGTQSDMIGKNFIFSVISPGELLRQEQEKGSELGLKTKKIMEKGKLVPDNLVETLILAYLKNIKKTNGFIFDGYPRNSFQQRHLIKFLQSNGWFNDTVAVEVGLSDETAIGRISGRRVCECGASYHLEYNPPLEPKICDLCKRKLVIRDDDKPATIRLRLKIYHEDVSPLLNFWQTNCKLIRVDGGQPIKKVYQDITKKLNEFKIL